MTSRPGALRLVSWVAGAELRQALRDPNSIIFSVLYPMFLFPVLMFLQSQGAAVIGGWQDAQRPTVYAPAELHAQLPTRVEVVPTEAEADLVVKIEGPEITVSYAGSNPRAALGAERVKEALEPELRLKRIQVAPRTESMASILGMVLPPMLLIASMLAALYPSVEAMVADRERQTLDTGLTTAAPRWVFIAGKFVAVAVGAITALLTTSVGFGLSTLSLLTALDAPLGLPPLRLLTILPPAVLCALLSAVVSLAAAAPTRSFKQAQNTTSTALMFTLGLAGFGALPFVELNAATAFIPITSVVLLMREYLLGNYPLGWSAIVAAEHALLIVAVGAFVVVTWQRESGR